MPNIAQQDYIIIDWEGKDYLDAAKKAEVDAQLKNHYLANPLSLLSVVFANYKYMGSLVPILSFDKEDDTLITVSILDSANSEVIYYSISIA